MAKTLSTSPRNHAISHTVTGLCNLYSSQNTISIIKIRRLIWVWLVVLMVGNTMLHRDLFIETGTEREVCDELGVVGK
jgi:hypothetical protein